MLYIFIDAKEDLMPGTLRQINWPFYFYVSHVKMESQTSITTVFHHRIFKVFHVHRWKLFVAGLQRQTS